MRKSFVVYEFILAVSDKQKWVKVTQSYSPNRSYNSWGSRAGRGGGRSGRSMW